MNEWELLAEILEDLNLRLASMEVEGGTYTPSRDCRVLIDRLRMVMPRNK